MERHMLSGHMSFFKIIETFIIYVVLISEGIRKEMLPIEDEIIIDRYIVRDEKAISYTADKYGKQLVAIANRICDDLDIAEECENDTYLRAWNSCLLTNHEAIFLLFLAKITRNLALDRYKESNRLKKCYNCGTGRANFQRDNCRKR